MPGQDLALLTLEGLVLGSMNLCIKTGMYSIIMLYGETFHTHLLLAYCTVSLWP
jgi:hypothetical protein